MKSNRTVPGCFVLAAEAVKSVYSGRDGKCCCGCAGTHSTAKAQITRVVNVINRNRGDIVVGSNNVSVVVGTRLYIAYVQ